jgi:hypothetical protein
MESVNSAHNARAIRDPIARITIGSEQRWSESGVGRKFVGTSTRTMPARGRTE